MKDDIKTTVFDDGLRIVTQKADFNSTFIGAWVKTGLINESDDENGLSHFLEHMLFKGTETKSALELSNYIERLGGECNAYTSEETTVVHTKLLPEHWKFGVDFLADVIQNSTFPKEEIEREREVIMQEIAMHENDPMSVIFNKFAKNIYDGDPLGRNILGTRKNITSFTRDNLLDYYNKWYTSNNIVISACGDIDHDEFVDYIKEQFTSGFREKDLYDHAHNDFKVNESRSQDIFTQSQFIIAAKGLCLKDDEKDRLKFALLENIIDGGMSCRLFQEIREKHGLAYQVGLMTHSLEETGFFGIHASLDERNIDKAIQLSKEVLASVKTNISEEELEKSKNTILYTLATSYDSCAKLASVNAVHTLYNLPYKSYEEIKEMVHEISLDDLFEIANKYIPEVDEDKYSVTVITPYDTVKTNGKD